MQPTEASIVTLWVLVMLALVVAGAALSLGLHLTREHKVLGAQHGDVLATANHALGMVKMARDAMTRMAVAAVSTREGSAAIGAAAAKEVAPSVPAALVPTVQQPSAPAPIVVPEPPALPAEPAWSSHLADILPLRTGFPGSSAWSHAWPRSRLLQPARWAAVDCGSQLNRSRLADARPTMSGPERRARLPILQVSRPERRDSLPAPP